MIDYLTSFPIPNNLLPTQLRKLLEPVGLDPALRVEVSCSTEKDQYGVNSESVYMLMAVVPDDGKPLPILNSDQGLVAYSIPVLREKGSNASFNPSVDGYDYIVASWGDGSFSTYTLAEKVWMLLGLTPRCLGNEQQRLIYDDLQLPEFDVAEGELSSQYYYESSRNVRWLMSNEYLRKYLWLRGGRGIRQFYYQAQLPDGKELRDWMNGKDLVELGGQGNWMDGDIRKENGGYLLQVWATVEAVSCELCPGQTAEGIVWPGIQGSITRTKANSLIDGASVYLNDRFLERYEQNNFYQTTPSKLHGTWHCSPSYLGQWHFTDCKRVGRNLIKVQLRELYKGKPDREILHAYAHALDPKIVEQFDINEEHIVSKVSRLLAQLLSLGDNLSRLGEVLDIKKSAQDLTGILRGDINSNGWSNYPKLEKLAQTAPLDMSQQAFLARCKSIHEFWQVLPDGFLKRVLVAAGVPKKKIADYGSLKLLQSLLNIVEYLDRNDETSDAFLSESEPEEWDSRNEAIAMLFVTNQLRIGDAHDTVSEVLQILQDRGFDTASLRQGYGRALDFIFDGVIEAFAAINNPLQRILAKG